MTNRNDQVISILNFNPKSRREPILNSPRSIEACRRQGIEPRELVVKYFADFKEQYRFKKISNEALVIMTEHHEERRKDKVQIVIEEREQVIEDIEDGYVIGPVSPAKGTKPKMTSPRIAKSSIQSLLSTATDSTTIELEKRRFDQINRKNAKQIRHLVEHGDQVSEIKEENELRKAEEREKARLEELQKEQVRKEAAERKRLAELEKHRRLQEEEEIRKQMALEAKKKDDLKMALEQEEQRKKQAEAKMKEEENKRKHEVFLKNLESKAQERQEEIYERQKEIEQQEKLSKEQLEEQQLEKKRANEHKKRVTKAKIMLTQEKNSEIMAKRKMDYDSKLEQEEEKRRQFELERQQKLEENKRAAMIHAQNIQKVIEENEKMQDEKKGKYNAKISKYEEKQKEFDAQRELEMQNKAEEDRKREEARQRVKEHMETMVKEKVNKYLEMREESQEKFVKVRREKEEELKKKHRAELIEYTEKMENIQRAAKKDEYKRQKLREKIQEEDERVEKIKNDKSTLMEMRKMIKRDLDLNKESLNEKFELMRSGKLKNNLSVDGAYPRTIRSPQDMSVLQSTSTINSPSPVARSMKGGASKVEAQDMSVIQSTSPINSPSTVARSLKTGASKVFEALSRIIAPKKPEKPAQPNLSEVKTMPDEERNRGLDELKAKHNQAMLRLLEDERQKEKQREAKLKSILYSEDKKRKV